MTKKVVIESETGDGAVVIDKNGILIHGGSGKRIFCGRLSSGAVGVSLLDVKGNVRGSLDLNEERVAVVLFDAGGKARTRLAVQQDSLSDLSFWNGDGKAQIFVGMDEANGVIDPAVVINDKGENWRAALRLIKDSPAIMVADDRGATIWKAPPGQ